MERKKKIKMETKMERKTETRMVIQENSFYELDMECVRKNQKREKETGKESGKKSQKVISIEDTKRI